MTKIIIDHRERSSGIVEELEKHGLQVELRQLISADFVLQTKDKNNDIQTIGVERKTQEDFINSIIDKRLITQLSMLKEHFSIPLLIIEGSQNIYAIRDFHPNAIRGMLASIAIDQQIPILHTKNYKDTASTLAVIAKRLEKGKKLISLLERRKPLTLKEQQEYLIESLPGIGPTLSKSLLKHFGSIQAIINASEEELMEVDKLGPIKSKKIKEVINSLYHHDSS